MAQPRADPRGAAAFLTGPGEEIELWAWFGAYDHVALCQLWGAMPALPRPIPRFTRELRQRWDDLGQPALPPKPTGTHDALVDARYNLVRVEGDGGPAAPLTRRPGAQPVRAGVGTKVTGSSRRLRSTRPRSSAARPPGWQGRGRASGSASR